MKRRLTYGIHYQWGRLTDILIETLPIFCSVILIFFASHTYGLPGLDSFMPCVEIIAVYFWTIARSEIMHIGWVIVIGGLVDLLQGMPLGLTVFLLVSLHVILMKQKRLLERQEFLVIWLGAVLAITMILWCRAIYFFLLLQHPLPLEPLFMQWILSCVGYSVLHYLFNQLLHKLPYKLPHA